MIASLHGDVIDIGLNTAVIECTGVGYTFTATPQTLATLRRGESARVLTTLVVREDAMNLYGFTDVSSREMFALLQSVSGLGPRLALAAQSVFSPAELATAIAGGDAKSLQRIPGVGKRMAERMIVDLRDKVGPYSSDPTPESPMVSVNSVVPEQVIEALVGLGFPERTAGATVAAVAEENPGLDTAGALRAALARLGRG
ncbi:Holliday junction branch migration protein RuvA [Corynebacterium sp. CCM 9185]|uniref:Holliday junction branch migration complex subunit RuvA n=1 Tax=Corynebacterium marambiense TaxID=2765364 RepID=A0ABS0VUZ3_9CORY|nr:Holliday junction branch migration protein RuvA [Corynebacterium marambiense]MBI9000583.1 Holliday junction branch migration protein RuvA [Corynebacterium marambiense]MCK7663154.1 Holliday junction branch migration protein RuvA [Corynebacterium marambiense]MCX7542768.1 Holliday junction branch migration protein RuvA [Corynebacterium marambiense]